ncbi:MAG: hypothetical protein ACXIUM_02495 [Wenzhouxiangella sp.]
MRKITATEPARNLRAVLDQVAQSGEDYLVERSGWSPETGRAFGRFPVWISW